MSLFRYAVLIKGGQEKIGRMTAKTEAEARERIEKKVSVVEWRSIVAELPAIAAAPMHVPKPRALSKLGKMLYLQSGRCFFCGQPLKEADASIEHLNPKSRGGSSTEDNEVVCHASLNETFGSMDLKHKFAFVLKSAGSFTCPKK
jgi:5-methylcytosine-specific restriction endonuclease McrA